MYVDAKTLQPVRPRRGNARVPSTVVALGVVSLLTDVSSEAVVAVLPIYLTVVVGLSPVAYGVVDGLYQGVSAATRIPAGWLADRLDRPKWVAVVGYGLSAAAKALLLPAAGLTAITAVVTADRIGKGLRTAPRDSLITTASDAATLGRNFGVHRAMDTVGAMLGPLMAFALLALVPDGYDLVFLAAFASALLGLAVLGLAVPDARTRPERASRPARVAVPRPTLAALGGPWFVRVCVAAGALALVTVSDGFLYLSLQERDDFAGVWFPLLFVGTSVTYLSLAVPLGRLADRVGRMRVFVLGHLALLAAYLCVVGPVSGTVTTVLALLLLGTYYAATDGVLAAVAGAVVPAAHRATGIATVQTVVVVGRLLSSLLFGLVWTLGGNVVAVTVYAVGLAVMLPLAWWVLHRGEAAGTDGRPGAPAVRGAEA